MRDAVRVMRSSFFVMIRIVAVALPSPAEATELEAAIARSRQLIVVTAPDWNSNRGVLQLLERAAGGGEWQRVGEAAPVMLGRNGLAWGIGLHKEQPTKREGDGRAPAGVFELERVYGAAPAGTPRFPYQQLREVMECIDDSDSRSYNRIVDAAEMPARQRDWTRTETVRAANPMFRWLVEVKHNWEQRPGYGSCIWLHIWKAPGVATSGCTAMDTKALERLVPWLEARKRPLLVQLPRAEMQRLLPEIVRE